MKSFGLPTVRSIVAVCVLVWTACGGRSDLDDTFRSDGGAAAGGKGGSAGSIGSAGSAGNGIGGAAGFGVGGIGIAGNGIPFCGNGVCEPGEPGNCFVDCPTGDRCGDGICGRTESFMSCP